MGMSFFAPVDSPIATRILYAEASALPSLPASASSSSLESSNPDMISVESIRTITQLYALHAVSCVGQAFDGRHNKKDGTGAQPGKNAPAHRAPWIADGREGRPVQNPNRYNFVCADKG